MGDVVTSLKQDDNKIDVFTDLFSKSMKKYVKVIEVNDDANEYKCRVLIDDAYQDATCTREELTKQITVKVKVEDEDSIYIDLAAGINELVLGSIVDVMKAFGKQICVAMFNGSLVDKEHTFFELGVKEGDCILAF